MRYLLIILSLISFGVSQYFGANIMIGGSLPKGELMEQGVPNAISIDFNGKYYINDYAAVGLNIGGAQYGFSERGIPFNQWSNVGLIEQTSNNIFYSNLFLKIIPFTGPVQIYAEGLLGFKNLYTKTKLFSENSNCNNPDTNVNECEIASTTDASDFAFSYGLGAGLEIFIKEFKDSEESNLSNILSLIVSTKYLWGGDVKYLKEGGITVTPDPDGVDFPIIDYDWNESKTDILFINIGIQLTLK